MEKTRPISKTITGVSLILFVASLCLFSCDGGNKRTNAFVAGTFEGIARENKNISTHLVVTEINKDDYSNANGVNVVQDSWNLKYYNLQFHTINEDGSKTKYDFVNLKDSHPTVTAQPIYYKSDSYIDISPWGLINGKLEPKSSDYYAIYIYEYKMTKEYKSLVLHTFLYPKGG